MVELLDEQGVLVESRQVGASVRTASFTVQDYTQYTVRVTVSDAYQSSLPASATVTVALERPAPPELRATFREDDPDYPASVLLEASVVTGLEITRMNLGPVEQWSQVGTGPVGFSDTDDMGLNLASGSASLGGLEIVAGDEIRISFEARSTYGGVTVYFEHGSQSVPISIGRDWRRYTATITAAMSGGGLILRAPDVIDLYVRRILVTTSRSSPDPSLDYFTEESTRPGNVYGRTGGRVYEAVPVATGGDIPLGGTTRVEFWRSADDGTTWQRVGDAGSDWSLVDTQPPLLARLLYKARAYAEQGGWAESSAVEVSAKACDAFVHYADIVLRGGYEPSYTGTAGRQSVLRRYVGRDKPSAVFGGRAERTQAYRITLLDDSTPLARWVTAAEHPGTVTVRDPGGRVLVGVLSDFSWDDSTEDEQTVSLTVTESEALP